MSRYLPRTITAVGYEDQSKVYLTKRGRLYPLASTKAYMMNRRSRCFIQPSTYSCFMEVESFAVSGPAKYPKHSILELYDWRYAAQLRQNSKINLWTQSREDAHRNFVENADAAKFIASLDDETDGRSWNTAQNEAYLFAFSRGLYQCKLKAYGYLKDLQGKNVP